MKLAFGMHSISVDVNTKTAEILWLLKYERIISCLGNRKFFSKKRENNFYYFIRYTFC